VSGSHELASIASQDMITKKGGESQSIVYFSNAANAVFMLAAFTLHRVL